MYKKLKERKNINEKTLKYGFLTSYAQIRFMEFVLKNFLQPRLQTMSKFRSTNGRKNFAKPKSRENSTEDGEAAVIETHHE